MNYKEIINKYYDGSLFNSFLDDTNIELKKGKENKVNYIPVWNDFINHVKNLEGVAKIRDTSYSCHPEIGKVTIGINNNVEEGITFNINYLTEMIGVYFCNYKEIAKIPIININQGTLNHLSYFPYNKKQINFSITLIDLFNTFFQKFQMFNNLYADEIANNVVIDNSICEKANYFQVLFDSSMDGIS